MTRLSSPYVRFILTLFPLTSSSGVRLSSHRFSLISLVSLRAEGGEPKDEANPRGTRARVGSDNKERPSPSLSVSSYWVAPCVAPLYGHLRSLRAVGEVGTIR